MSEQVFPLEDFVLHDLELFVPQRSSQICFIAFWRKQLFYGRDGSRVEQPEDSKGYQRISLVGIAISTLR